MNSAAVRSTVLVLALGISAASAPPSAGRQGSTRTDVVESSLRVPRRTGGHRRADPSAELGARPRIHDPVADRLPRPRRQPTDGVLDRDRADLWDSGRVASTDSTWIRYGGKTLASGQRVYWKVRVWGDAGTPSAWSAPGDLVDGPAAGRPTGTPSGSASGAPDGAAEGTPLPFPWLRKTFTLAQKPSQGRGLRQSAGLLRALHQRQEGGRPRTEPGGQRLLEAESLRDARSRRLPGAREERGGAVAGPRLVRAGATRA